MAGLEFISNEQLIQDYKEMGCLFSGVIGEVIKAEMIERGIWSDEYEPGLTKEAVNCATGLMKMGLIS